MPPMKDRDPPLPAIPENSASKLASSSCMDEDAEDREEQGLFERDNVATYEEDEVGDDDAVDGSTASADGQNNNFDGGISSGPLYVQTSSGDSWELTWPIYHMLPRDERRAIATQHGFRLIGDFEEYMSLATAVDESEGRVEGEIAAVETADVVTDSSATTNWHPPFIEDDDDSSVSSEEDKPTVSIASESSNDDDTDNIDLEEMIRLGGLPCSIPDEILHKCFAYLPVDDHATLALVSPYWSRFTRCESLYKTLCERIYLNQSKRKVLHVNRFGNSYRKMLELRPRVRTGGGIYVLKYSEVRKIQRDMWTEIPLGAVLESVYYRYLYFFEDGRCMYALTHATPVEMIPRLEKMQIHGYGSKDKWGVWGRYQIKKDTVRVWASHSWHDVCFQLKVIPSNKVLHYATGDRGLYTTMMLEKHMSSPSGNFEDDSYDRVEYEIPDHCYFQYLRDRRL